MAENPQALAQQIYFLQNPQAGLQYQQQQMLAQQMMQQGSQYPDTHAMVGNVVAPVSPWADASKAAQQMLGAYMMNKSNTAYGNAMTPQQPNVAQATNAAIGSGEGPATQQQVGQQLGQMMQGGGQQSSYNNFNPDAPTTPQDRLASLIDPIGYKAKKDAEFALYNKQHEPIKQADGTYTTYADSHPNAAALSAPSPQVSPTRPAMPSANPTQLQATGSNTLPNGQPDTAASIFGDNKGNDLPAASVSAGQNQPASNVSNQGVPMASDGKPIIPEAANLGNSPPDPKFEPKFTTSNTEQGVAQNKLNQVAMDKGSDEFSTFGRSLSIEGSRVDNLIGDYQKVQSGTLTGLHPDTMAYLSALGLKNNDLAGIQAAMNTHILDAIGQMKDTNANIGGGAPTRLFGAEINKLLDDGASVKDQPAALYNILTQAKGIVNHSQDMVSGWDAIGGRGNRVAGGDSMLPDTYTQKFVNSHPIQGYIDNAQKTTAPFMGMKANAPLKTPSGISYSVVQ